MRNELQYYSKVSILFNELQYYFITIYFDKRR